MTNCTSKRIQLSNLKNRKIEANFNGGDVTSDAGVLFLREADKRLGLTRQLANVIPDDRDQRYVTHPLQALLQQRIFGLALGYEDLNDHDTLRHDLALQTSVERDDLLAGSSTFSRLENQQDRQVIVDMHKVLIKQFLDSYKQTPNELILDFDATDDLVHGNQEGRAFHGYYGNYCFLPLYVFCGKQLLVSYLRPSNQDGAKHSWAILSLLVKRIRERFPETKIIFRGDGGFCRHQMFNWCERRQVYYITGIAKNNNLLKQSADLQNKAKERFEITQTKQRLFQDFHYAAKSWKRKRRIIHKAEHAERGENPRFIVTNLTGDPNDLYDNVYCARGNMENRIKEQQYGLFADRTSCHYWWANQFRLMLSSMAYVLMNALRVTALKGTEFAKAQCTTLRLKLLKIGAVVIRNTRRVKFLLSSTYPYQTAVYQLLEKLLSPSG